MQQTHKWQRFYEIKYKIPTKWTKKFNINDVLPVSDKVKIPPIIDEFGRVNDPLPKFKRTKLSPIWNETQPQLNEEMII